MNNTGSKMDQLFGFFMELDKLKGVYRQSFLSDQSRNENSAEHSWHLAMALLTMREELDLKLDMMKAMKMALVHDICEIGAGDISVYDPGRAAIDREEQAYLDELSEVPLGITTEIRQLWEEYEAQETTESRWVKVVDRLLPFMLNMATEGRSWKERNIRKSQVLQINETVREEAPDVYEWLLVRIDEAVGRGWLVDS